MVVPGMDSEAARRAGFIMELRSRNIRDTRVLSAIERVPRQVFVPLEVSEYAYADRQLPIACGQMIDRPSVAGRIVEALAVEEGHRVLEIGSGSGWLSAVLGQLAREVVSLERFRLLADSAADLLRELDIVNVTTRFADGLDEEAIEGVFDRIYLAGSVAEVPAHLFAALSERGVLIAPVGANRYVQELKRYAKAALSVHETSLGPARFVPLVPGLARSL